MRNLLLVVLVLLVIVAGVWAAANFGFDQTKVKTDTVYGTIDEIVVKTDDGDVDLVPARRAHRGSRDPALGRLQARARADAQATACSRIESSCAAETVILKCYSDLRVAVPAGVKVTVEADSGDVDLRGTDVGSVHAESDSGDIEMDLAGRQRLVFASSDSGDLDVVARVGARRRRADELRRRERGHRRPAAPRRRAQHRLGDVEVAVPRGRLPHPRRSPTPAMTPTSAGCGATTARCSPSTRARTPATSPCARAER